MNYASRNYVIFNVSEIDKVDFTQVLETSPDTLRKSVDGTKTFVKWDSPVEVETTSVPADQPEAANDPGQIVEIPSWTPAFVDTLTTKEGPYTHSEIIEILSTPEWTAPYDPSQPGA